jgi:dipeptidyl aminopeptidase/acylaminoacyl peptidase
MCLNSRRLIFLLLTATAALSGPLRSDAGTGDRRRFEVRDSVEMSYFGTPASSAPDDMDDDGIASPDGRHFIKVTHRGVLPQGMTEGTIWLFDTATIKQSLNDPRLDVPKAVPLVRMSTSVNSGLGLLVLDAGNTISAPKWSKDSRSLTFLGRDGHVNRRLFCIDLDSRNLRTLTPPTQDVLAYARSGSELIYMAGADADLQVEQAWVSAGPGIPDVAVGTGTPLMPLLYPHFKGNAFGEPIEVELWRIHEDRATPVVDAAKGVPVRLMTRYTSLLVSLSPDATQALTIATDSGGAASAATELRYQMIDLRSGGSARLNGAALAREGTGRYLAAWAPDGAQVAFTRVLSGSENSEPLHPSACEIVLLRIGSTAPRCIARREENGPPIFALEWPHADRIRARYKGFRQSTYSQRVLHRRGSAWIVDERSTTSSGSVVELGVYEGLDKPPVLLATDPGTGKSRVIFDPNPQLADIALGSISVYRWKDAHGREDVGGLVKPPDFEIGKRYGLVIQTHGFNPRQFFRAGYSDTSNAGRALASRDLLVLQVDEPHAEGPPTWRDGAELGMDVYTAAIDKLAAEGIVDSTKVGISGYSYSGWLVATSITRAPKRFAAAEIANSDPVTLTGYYEYVGTPLAQADADFYVGARPYGEGLKAWIERVPSFSTDKIIAPVLFQPANPWHLLGIWDMYAAMLDQKKPVELQYMRSGEHNIRKPLQVFAHQEMIVDWFDFWLNGHEENDPTKREQYVRWRKLRQSRDTSEGVTL